MSSRSTSKDFSHFSSRCRIIALFTLLTQEQCQTDSSKDGHDEIVAIEHIKFQKRSPTTSAWQKYLHKVNKYEGKSRQRGSFEEQVEVAEKIANNQIKLTAWSFNTPSDARAAGDMYLAKLARTHQLMRQSVGDRAYVVAQIRRWDQNRKFWRQMQQARSQH